MEFLKYVYYFLLLLGLIILLIRWNRLDKLLHIFLPIYVLAIMVQGVDELCSSFPVGKRLVMFHTYTFIECTLLMVYYYRLFQSKRNKQITRIGYVLFVLYYIWRFVLNNKHLFVTDFSDFVAEAILISPLSIFFLIELYESDEVFNIKQYPHFWIVIANLCFYSGCVFVMGFAYYIGKKFPHLYSQLMIINHLLNLLLYSFYIKAFLCNSKTKKLL
jgi:hypothetical protein